MVAKENSLHFTVDGQLVSELGERLVSKNHVALSELIKNAYDADSPAAVVSLEKRPDLETGLECEAIVISDSGEGMSFVDVRDNWMRIATSNKVRKPISGLYGRQKTGNKGIGRFSCQRLARQLRLVTVRKDGGVLKKTTVDFVWSDFTSGKELAEIPCKYRRTRPTKGKQGTTLELIGLRDNWTGRDWYTLRRAVVGLCMGQPARRRGFRPDPGFSIEMRIPGVEGLSGDLREQVMDAGWGRVQGSVDEFGNAFLELVGKYVQSKKRHTIRKEFGSLTGLSLDIAWINRGWSEDQVDMNRNRRILSKQVIEDFAESAGIRIYDNGFRVFPFGERGDDWLDLDRDYARRFSGFYEKSLQGVSSALGLSSRDVGLLRPRPDNLAGSVMVSSKSMKLVVNMDREGFLQNAAFEDLKRLVKAAVEFLAVHYAYAKLRKDSVDARQAEEEFAEAAGVKSKAADPVNEAVSYITTHAKAIAGGKGDRQQLRAVETAARVITTRYTELGSEIEVLRAIASSAPLLFMFSHEINNLLSHLDSSAMVIEDIHKHVRDAKARRELNNAAAFLRGASANFAGLTHLFGFVSRARLAKRHRVMVHKLIDSLVSGTRFSTEKSAIDVVVRCDRYQKTPPMKEAEFISIAANLYSNALKSVYAKDGGRVQIEAHDDGGDFVFQVKDTGVGIKRENWDEVLKPFVSDPEEKIYSRLQARYGSDKVSVLGKGTGLGLSIVNGIADAYGGRVCFSKPSPWSICIGVKIPHKRRRNA